VSQAESASNSNALPGPAEREAIVASLRGALTGEQSLTATLERDRQTEREREERTRVGLLP
jgi:hypothetical protein